MKTDYKSLAIRCLAEAISSLSGGYNHLAKEAAEDALVQIERYMETNAADLAAKAEDDAARETKREAGELTA